MASIELSQIIAVASTETIKATEKILQQFRTICQSDEEFSKRMSTYCSDDQPRNITQFYFDDAPVFFSKFELKDNKINITFHQGAWNAI